MTLNNIKFKDYLLVREGKENFGQPHTISADPPMKIPSGIKRIAEAFKNSKSVPIGKEIDSAAGGEKEVTLKAKKLYIVGGAVRDYLLGHTPKNYNLVTDAHPEELAKILQHARPAIRVGRQDPKKGVTAVEVDGESYEIHTLKKKSENPDEGEVFTTNPAEDSEGRDLTVNAMYYDVLGNKIIDHVGGIRHAQEGTIRPVGKAEEKLKGMGKYRMMRFMNTVPNGKIDDDTKEALGKATQEDDDTPPDHIRQEFLRGLEHAHSNVAKYVQSYADHGLLEKVFPKLELSYDFPEGSKNIKNRAVVLAFLLRKNKPSKLVPKLKDLGYTEREVKDAVYLINLLWFAPDHIYDFKRELVNTGLTRRQILDWAKLAGLDKNMIEKMVDHQLMVNGGDLAEKEGLQGDNLRARVREMEAGEFKKKLEAD